MNEPLLIDRSPDRVTAQLNRPDKRNAIDRETIVNSLLPEGAEAAIEFMPPTVDGYADDVTTYEYDPDRARQLLTEAGALGTTLRFFYPTDVTRPYLPDPAAMYQVISQNLTDAGFTVVPTALPWNPDYLNAVQSGGADIHLLGWTGDYNDAYNFIGTFFAEASNNQASAEFGAFSAPEIFAALAAADAEPDPDDDAHRGPLADADALGPGADPHAGSRAVDRPAAVGLIRGGAVGAQSPRTSGESRPPRSAAPVSPTDSSQLPSIR